MATASPIPAASARVLNTILGSDTALALFRMLHPDAAHRLVLRLQPMLGENDRGSSGRLKAFAQQETWARARLAREQDVGLVIMAHTHHAAMAQLSPSTAVPQPGRLVRRLPLCGRDGVGRGAPHLHGLRSTTSASARRSPRKRPPTARKRGASSLTAKR